MAKRNTFSEDEIYEEKFDINQVKRLFHYVKPYRAQIALIAVLMLSSSGPVSYTHLTLPTKA